jgi:hypothetical protein
LVLNALQVIAH